MSFHTKKIPTENMPAVRTPIERTPTAERSPPHLARSTSPRRSTIPGDIGHKSVSYLLLIVQAILAILMYFGTTYSDTFKLEQYVAFRDIMMLLLIGFGFLAAFLKNYGLGAIGFTMMLMALGIQINILSEWAFRAAYLGRLAEITWPMPITLMTLINAEFSVAAVLITFRVVIGRTSPLQLVTIIIFESIIYACFKVMVFGAIGAEDVGGTFTVHMFGAYFGLAISSTLGVVRSIEKATESDKVSDIFSFLGTSILWVYWPSFVGAAVIGVEVESHRCMVNTVFALLGSTVATFFLSNMLTDARFEPVHISNSTLSGGVAIGAIARLNIGVGSALLVGILAGLVSVAGYVYTTPFLESKPLAVHDTCGVGNLHGLPSILGGLLSIVFVLVDLEAPFLMYSDSMQASCQFLALLVTITIAVVTGKLTGRFVKTMNPTLAQNFEDSSWWQARYFESETEPMKTNDSS